MKWVSMFAIVCVFGCGAAQHTSQLASTSENPEPIAWESWTPQAFEKAKRERRHILVSLQASWCHWCHVMNDTTYEDPAVRKKIAAGYVAIKVDSDARPDLAERYADYAWPATVFFSPDATEIVALRGYRSPPVFHTLLTRIVNGEVPENTDEPASPESENTKAAITTADAQLDALFDIKQGGWGKTQKYPLAAAVEATMLRASLNNDSQLMMAMLKTLEGHAQLIDPAWGGMFQYSLRGVWDKPHFEKITAIQAGGIKNFAHAYGITGDEVWKSRALAVVTYMDSRMRDASGGFYTSQNADSKEMTGTEFYALSAEARDKVASPRIDKEVYADLNGRMIDALCALHNVAPDTDALRLAVNAAEALQKTHISVEGEVRHGAQDTGLRYLSDQAHVLRGMLSLYFATGEARWLTIARSIAEWSLENLYEGSSFFAHTVDPAARGSLAERRRPAAHNSVMAQSLLTLYRLTEEESFDIAGGVLLAVSPEAQRRGRKIGDWSLALRQAASSYVLLSIVGPKDDPITNELARVGRATIAKNHLIEVSEPGKSRYPYPGKPAVYLCSDSSCSIPLSDPAELSTRINEFLSQNDKN